MKERIPTSDSGKNVLMSKNKDFKKNEPEVSTEHLGFVNKNVRNAVIRTSEVPASQLSGLESTSLNIWNAIHEILQILEKTYNELSPHQLQIFVIVFISLFQIGCQYSPDFLQDYKGNRVRLNDEDIEKRWQEAERLFEHKSDSIAACQDDLMRENLLELIEETDDEYLESYIQTCQYLRKHLHVENFTRYSPRFLREVERNIRETDYKSNLPVVLAIVAHQDHETTLIGTQALTVESHSLEELTNHFKVILMESHSLKEIEKVVKLLEEREILRNQNLAGVISGAHSSSTEMETGINTENMHYLSRFLHHHFSPENKGLIVLAGCNTADDSEESITITDSATLYFRNAHVVGCSSLMLGMDFSLDENNRRQVTPDQVQMRSWLDYLSFGVTDSSESPKREDVLKKFSETLSRELPNIPSSYVLTCVRQEIFAKTEIRKLHEHGISEELINDYNHVHQIPADTIISFIEKGISTEHFEEQVTIFRENGQIIDEQVLYAIRMGVSAQEIYEFSEHCSENRSLIQKSVFILTSRDLGIPKDDLFAYLAIHPEMNSFELQRISREGISPEEYQKT